MLYHDVTEPVTSDIKVFCVVAKSLAVIDVFEVVFTSVPASSNVVSIAKADDDKIKAEMLNNVSLFIL